MTVERTPYRPRRIDSEWALRGSLPGGSPRLATFEQAAGQFVIGPVPEPLMVEIDVGRVQVPGTRVAEGPDRLDDHRHRDGHPEDDQQRSPTRTRHVEPESQEDGEEGDDIGPIAGPEGV